MNMDLELAIRKFAGDTSLAFGLGNISLQTSWCIYAYVLSINTIYDRIDAAATINFSMQFGAATIRERHLQGR